MKSPAMALLLLAGMAAQANATLLRCETAGGIPLFTDSPVAGRGACTEHGIAGARFSVNAGMLLEQVPAGRSARTQRQIDRAQGARRALRRAHEQRERACQRARSRAAAGSVLPLPRQKQLNLAAFHACQ